MSRNPMQAIWFGAKDVTKTYEFILFWNNFLFTHAKGVNNRHHIDHRYRTDWSRTRPDNPCAGTTGIAQNLKTNGAVPISSIPVVDMISVVTPAADWPGNGPPPMNPGADPRPSYCSYVVPPTHIATKTWSPKQSAVPAHPPFQPKGSKLYLEKSGRKSHIF